MHSQLLLNVCESFQLSFRPLLTYRNAKQFMFHSKLFTLAKLFIEIKFFGISHTARFNLMGQACTKYNL